MGQSLITPALRARLDEDRYHKHRLGCWLPKDRKIVAVWVKQLMQRMRDRDLQDLDKTLKDFKNLVDEDPILKPLSDNMFTEVPDVFPYNKDPRCGPELQSFEEMLNVFNILLTQGPQWNDIANKIGLIGLPFNAVLDWPMATASGYMFFLFPKVNECLKAVLDRWEEYLTDVRSVEVLNGWLDEAGGLKHLLVKGNENGIGMASAYDFPELYKCPDRNDPNTYGFSSWDAFFTRDFEDHIRDVESPNDDSVITHACESAPLQYPVENVQLSDNFQGKNQCYSLIDMMNQSPLANRFVGGTVYQAFLSCLSYHRWHAPVSGTIKNFEVVQGTYYSQNLYQTFFGHWPTDRENIPDPAAPTWSQPYIATVAARGLIFIEADNPAVGLVCFIAIGMTDTSGCEITVTENQHVNKGDQLGIFHFGGSSYCLVFGPQVKLQWTGIPEKDSELWPSAFDDDSRMPNFRVKSLLATVDP